ncbi:unnamed protein product, partial [Mesorhabditis belari]|uniref:Uncharacterized protein n=1 Tax=Mesorhabditis belari TaxID=2138241 RepID=A0AAF3FP63_9BILA
MDYYGDYSGYSANQRAYPSAPPLRSNGTIRQTSRKVDYYSTDTNYLCVVATCLALRAVATLFIIGSLYYLVGSSHNLLVLIGGFECATMFTILMMYCGVSKLNPWLCAPYAVFRTVEFFLWGLILFALILAIKSPEGEYFTEAYTLVRLGAEYLRMTNSPLNLRDLTLSLCWVGLFVSLTALGLASEAMRHAWVTTARVVDSGKGRSTRRRDRGDSDTRRIMIASDEFNYA